MKAFKSYIGVLMMAFVAILSSCSPDSFEGADPNGIPSLDGVEPVVAVDQSINQVTFSLPADLKGCMPVWIFYENKGTDKEKIIYSTVNGLKKIFATAGDYEYEFKLMNRNGISDGSKSGTFHIDNTIVNYDKYFTMLCGGKSDSSKEWRIDNDKQGHLGCGEPNTTGLNWWSANPNDKKDWNVYDSRLTFTATGDKTKGGYHFNPGASGQIYVNKDVLAMGGPAGEDFCVDATEQDVEFEFEVVGEDVFIVFPEHTYFPYIANDDIWNTPRYKVESITPSEINLVIDNGGIAWHYILTSGAAKQEFTGFKYNSEFNLWKPVDEAGAFDYHFYYAPGWAQIADPGFAQNGNEYTFTLPEGTSDQWQAQCPLKPVTPLHLSADKKYDFSCVINSSENLPGVTVKLTDVNTGDNYVFVERVPVTAYEDYVFYLSDVNNLTADADVELFFDFGGNPANTTVTVKNIVVKDHANDDGTVLPSDEPGDEPGDVQHGDFTGENLLEGMNVEITQWYAPGWNQIADAEYSVNNGAYTITYPEAASDQWMAQFTFNNTGIALDPSKTYDFRCKIVSSANHPGVTVKLTQQDDDNTFITADRHAVKAYEETWVELVGLSFIVNEGGKGVINNLKMPFDFGGVAAGTEITISDMYLQEHKGPKVVNWDANSDANIWKNANPTLSEVYHADGGWSPYPAGSYEANVSKDKITFHMNQATANQWQAQLKIDTGIKKLDPSKKYHFQCKFNANNDLKNVTVKLCELGPNDTPGSLGINYDANTLFYDNNTNLSAYADYVFQMVDNDGITLQDNPLMIVFDFGGSPENFDVEITDIILLEE